MYVDISLVVGTFVVLVLVLERGGIRCPAYILPFSGYDMLCFTIPCCHNLKSNSILCKQVKKKRKNERKKNAPPCPLVGIIKSQIIIPSNHHHSVP
jgi:hypothetical protein